MNAPAKKLNPYVSLVMCVALLMAIGALSALVSGSGPSPWYDGLVKARLNPPAPVFGIVWSVLYALMGISLWLLIRAQATPDRTRAIQAFFLQLVINFAWSWVFFDRHWIGLAVLHILVLQVVLVAFLVLARRVNPWSAWINVPYLVWTLFALYLAFEIRRLNT